LFHDDSAEPGRSYFYRVIARSVGGLSPPSNVDGPVRVTCRTLVDPCADLSRTAGVVGAVEPTAGDDRRRREDLHRLAIPPGGSVTYRVDAPMVSWSATLFADKKSAAVSVAYSSDGKDFQPAEATREASGEDNDDYGYLPQIVLSSRGIPPNAEWLRLSAGSRPGDGPLELSHVEIRYASVE
jgi:hypothetical protein